jgi:hypothetical protein
MNVAAGGLISQAIVKDPKTYQWDSTQTKVFNVQILDSQHFQTVIGVAPPTSPVTQLLMHSTVSRSLAYMRNQPRSQETSLWSSLLLRLTVSRKLGLDLTGGFRLPVGLLPCRWNVHRHAPSISELQGDFGFFNPAGVISPFRAVTELESEVRAQNQLVF